MQKNRSITDPEDGQILSLQRVLSCNNEVPATARISNLWATVTLYSPSTPSASRNAFQSSLAISPNLSQEGPGVTLPSILAKTNVYTSSETCSTYELPQEDMYSFARALPRTEYSPMLHGQKSPIFMTLKAPHCTAVLNRSGKLHIMGGISETQAKRHMMRVAHFLRYRTLWRTRNDKHAIKTGSSSTLGKCNDRTLELGKLSHKLLYEKGEGKQDREPGNAQFVFGNIPGTIQKQRLHTENHTGSSNYMLPSSLVDSKSSTWEYVTRPSISFLKDTFKINQLVVTLHLLVSEGTKFSLLRIAAHPSIMNKAIELKGNLYVKIPVKEIDSRAGEGEECSRGSSSGDTESDEQSFLALRSFSMSNKTEESLEILRGIPSKAVGNGPAACIYPSGKVLIFGCQSRAQAEEAIKFLWSAISSAL